MHEQFPEKLQIIEEYQRYFQVSFLPFIYFYM